MVMINVDMNFFFKNKIIKNWADQIHTNNSFNSIFLFLLAASLPLSNLSILLWKVFHQQQIETQENDSVVSQENNKKIQSILQLVN